MRTYISLIILLMFTNPVFTQELMTIGEVFDFETGDKFQFKHYNEFGFPNAYRVEIIDKYYSANQDTVFYVRYHDNYWVGFGSGDTLEYHSETEVDTVKYINLDSCITTCWPDYDSASMSFYDTIIDADSYCDSLMNGIDWAVGFFEPIFYKRHYGKGIGEVYISEIQTFNVHIVKSLFYYQKNGVDCGTPDNTIVSTSEVPLPKPIRKLIKLIDLSGREITKPFKNQPYIEIYNDGTTQKKIKLE